MEYAMSPTQPIIENQYLGGNVITRTTFVREVRAVYRGPRRSPAAMRSPSTAAEFIRKVLPDNSREHFVVLHLDGANQVISYSVVATGTANSCPTHPREVFQGSVLVGAVALIVSHNHPSGDLTQSEDDRKITARLKEAATLLGIKFHDHIIVTDSGFHSFAEGGGL